MILPAAGPKLSRCCYAGIEGRAEIVGMCKWIVKPLSAGCVNSVVAEY